MDQFSDNYDVETTIAILSRDGEESADLKGAFELFENVRVIAFQEKSELLSWSAEGNGPVDAVLVDAIPLDDLWQLKEIPGRERTPFVLLSSAREEAWLEGIQRLSESVDNVILSPFDTGTIAKKANVLIRTTGDQNPSVLFLDETKTMRATLVEELEAAGVSKIYEVADYSAAVDALEKKSDQLSLVVCCWEMPLDSSVLLLRKMNSHVKYSRIPVLIVTSPYSIAKVVHVQNYDSLFDWKLIRPFNGTKFVSQMVTLGGRLDRHREANGFLREADLFLQRDLKPHAESILSHALRVVPDDRRVYEALGDVLVDLGREDNDRIRLERAANIYERAIRRMRWDPLMLDKVIHLLAELGQQEDLLRIAKQSLSCFGFDDCLRTWLGKVYLERGDMIAAHIELRRAFAFNPENREAKALLDEIEFES